MCNTGGSSLAPRSGRTAGYGGTHHAEGYGGTHHAAALRRHCGGIAACAAYGGDGSVASQIWEQYASSRPHVAPTPAAEAAAAIVRNADAIVDDAQAQCALSIGATAEEYDLALRAVVAELITEGAERRADAGDRRDLGGEATSEAQADPAAFVALAEHLDEARSQLTLGHVLCVLRTAGSQRGHQDACRNQQAKGTATK